MNVRRDQGRWTVHLNRFEAALLQVCLTRLAGQYAVPPAELDEPAAETWYSTRGCRSAGASPEDTRAWIDALQALRQSQQGPLAAWIAQLTVTGPGGATLRLSAEEVDPFLRAINDYRLLQAARHDVGEAEMERVLDEDAAALAPSLHTALLEIHFLAWLIEELLRAMDDS